MPRRATAGQDQLPCRCISHEANPHRSAHPIETRQSCVYRKKNSGNSRFTRMIALSITCRRRIDSGGRAFASAAADCRNSAALLGRRVAVPKGAFGLVCSSFFRGIAKTPDKSTPYHAPDKQRACGKGTQSRRPLSSLSRRLRRTWAIP